MELVESFSVAADGAEDGTKRLVGASARVVGVNSTTRLVVSFVRATFRVLAAKDNEADCASCRTGGRLFSDPRRPDGSVLLLLFDEAGTRPVRPCDPT